MKRKILVIHNGYPLRGDGGDKVFVGFFQERFFFVGFK